MNTDEKVEWVKRAFAEIAKECEEISQMDIVNKAEANAWRSVAATARRNIKILEQRGVYSIGACVAIQFKAQFVMNAELEKKKLEFSSPGNLGLNQPDDPNKMLDIYQGPIVIEDFDLFLKWLSSAWNGGGDLLLRANEVRFKRPKNW